ncbi:hypothetical protein GCM10010425_24970 [Streptomyces spororaveus]|uniref:ADP-ribosylglycohydrolase n=1 Tax=Streptomyces spororaveus TaxID=284039 RepID=A0ABQ3TGQ4_9ACTN|nr:hypothetical protein Sspor_51270 [Streptomyces spororaveus]
MNSTNHGSGSPHTAPPAPGPPPGPGPMVVVPAPGAGPQGAGPAGPLHVHAAPAPGPGPKPVDGAALAGAGHADGPAASGAGPAGGTGPSGGTATAGAGHAAGASAAAPAPGPGPQGHGPGESPGGDAPAAPLHVHAAPAAPPRGRAAPGGPGPAGANRTLGRGIATGLWGRVEQQDFRSRVRGTLLGSALGDALGAPAADLSLTALREAHGPDGLTGPAPALGRRGRVTAATQLSLFTVDGLIRAHVRRDTGAWHPPTDIHRAYLRWAATQHDWGPDERRKDNGWLAQEEWLYARRAPHRACLTGFADDVLGTLDQPKNPTARDAAAATRSAPFGLLVGWEPTLVLQLSVECAAQSHGHPTAHLSAGAVAVIVHGLVRGDSLDSAVQRALGLLGSRPGHQPVTDALQRALAAVTQGSPGPDAVEALACDGAGDGSDAAGALGAAVYCALVAEDVPRGLRLAVNHGGDSIAAGALCGALLGALHGETALPAAWLAELEGRSALLELADDFALEMTQGPSLHSPTAASPGWLARYPRG